MYAQLWNALQKHFFAYSALITGTLTGSTSCWSLISVPKAKILHTQFSLIFPCCKKSVSTKRAGIHLIWKIISYWLFFTKRLRWSRLYLCSYVVKVTDDIIAKSVKSFQSKLQKFFIEFFQSNLNYESIVDRRGPRPNPS